MSANVPPGWESNPSRWSRRLPLLALAGLGFCVALYLSLYQIGAYDSVYEPFFGDGSVRVLHSIIAQVMQPVPDALLGAVAYLVEIIAGSIGDSARWRSKPWAVCLYELTVLGLAAFSVALVICQPVLAHGWCTLCLCSAAISVSLVPLTADEALATLSVIRRQRRRGYSWRQTMTGPLQLSDVMP